ncbi:MAG: hypothetical protein JST84_08780 [Acidobacteria bacterium]|nr:hypothetical protein [Acidobacteriota bacterium]
MLKRFVFRGIGPASMGGRIDDFAVVESTPSTYYVAFATGGLWKTINNGTTFDPVFDSYSTHSIGDVAVCQSDLNIVWVGTGEANNRQSSSFGDGVFKSTDGGKTFTNVGLRETQSIARVVIDPKDPNIVYVAALGHLFGPNKERGVYKTTDGGKTWNNIKFINEDTGFTDIVIDPVDSKTLYATSYQRRRTAWGFNGGGPGTGIWKTIDAGKTWTKLEANGLPEIMLGRIGIDVARSNPNIVYAQIEVGTEMGTGVPAEGAEGQQGGGGGGGGGFGGQQNRPPDPKRSGIWRSDDKGKTWKFVSNENNRPMYYSQIRVDPTNAEIVYTGGLNFSRSTDGGKTFKNLSGVAHSDHHAIWIDPKDNKHLMVGNDGGLDVSYDQGETFDFINTIAAAQFYAISADMRKPYYVCGGLQDNGSWCGPSSTRAGGGNGGGGGGSPSGITNADWFRVGGGDGFYTLQDPTDPNIVYSESQNGAVQRYDLRTGQSRSIRPRAAQRPRGLGAGRGGGGATPQQPATTPPATNQGGQEQIRPGQRLGQAPAGGQSGQADDQQAQMIAFMQAAGGGFFGGGNPFQSNIVPAPPEGEQYRFYWNTPIHLSPHNPRTVYVGGNRLFRSLDRGDTWTIISADLTKQVDRRKLSIMGVAGDQPMASKHDGYASNSFISVLAESPIVPGVLWVGTEDGNLQVSKDGGVSWSNVISNVKGAPEGYIHISRVEPSHFDAGTCYVTIDNHRNDDMKPYVYVTKDYGATWTSIASNLPANGNVNVIREDPKNKNLLFVGTEYGLYISLNGGGEWKQFMTGLPIVRIDDLLIHPRDNDLIVGTHGRGIYICDDISPLQQLNDKTMAADVHLFEVRPGTNWLTDLALSRYIGGQKMFRGANAPQGTAISYQLKSAPSGDVKITISDITGKVVRNLTGTKEVGINRVQWNLRGDPPQRPAGFGGGFGGGGNAPTAPQTAATPASGSQPAGQPAAAGAAQPGQAGGRGGGGGGGGRGLNFGPALEPGAYLVKLTVDGKELTTKVVVEADTFK